jgi:hypothetical protein
MCSKRNAAWPASWITIAVLAFSAGCATREQHSRIQEAPSSAQAPPAVSERRAAPARPAPQRPRPVIPLAGTALIERLLPPGLADRGGWARDMKDAMAALDIEASPANICAVIAVTGHESGFRADPSIPNLAEIAATELEQRRERAGIPKVVVTAALALSSSDGRSYGERLRLATTERQLSDVFEDFAGRVPLAKSFIAERNPVRTGGPMQVSVAFAKAHAAVYPYPYKQAGSIREEVFSRRGGIYFGVAHLLHYPAPYGDYLYRFADFNAGRFASRNAAFQKAVSDLSGVPLQLDGDVLRYEQGQPAKERSRTELATLRLADRLGLTAAAIRRDLELGLSPEFELTRLYASVFALADRRYGSPAPRAILPVIVVQTFKTRRRLTSDGFARRVAERQRTCLARATSSIVAMH